MMVSVLLLPRFLIHRLSLTSLVRPVKLKVGACLFIIYLFIYFKLTTRMNLENVEHVTFEPVCVPSLLRRGVCV